MSQRKNDILYNILDQYTGEYVNYNKVTTYADGSGMNDGKCDGVIYKKFGTEYFKRSFIGPISIKWFGAKGDGVTDDINAFELAVIVARGGRLHIPRGKYKLSRALVISPDYPIIIGGEGVNVYNNTVIGGTILSWTSNVYGIVCENVDNAVEASHRIELNDFAMFGNDTASYGINLDWIHNLHINSLWISGFLNDGIRATKCYGLKVHKTVCTHNHNNGIFLSSRNNNVVISECVFNGNSRKSGYANIFVTSTPGQENLDLTISDCDFSYAGSGNVETITEAYNIVIAGTYVCNIKGCYSEGGDKTTSLAYIGGNTQNINIEGNYWQDGTVIFDSVKNSSFVGNTYYKYASTAPSNYLSGITDGVNGNDVYRNYNSTEPTVFKGRNDGLDLQKITDAGPSTNNDLFAKSLTAFDGGLRVQKVEGPHITFEDANSSGDIGIMPVSGETARTEMVFNLNSAEGFRIDKNRVLKYPADVSAYYTSRSLVDKAYVDSVAGTGGTGFSGTTANDIEITDSTKGIILKSPGGTRYRITVNNDGSITTTAL